jgi:hypothetical protein
MIRPKIHKQLPRFIFGSALVPTSTAVVELLTGQPPLFVLLK